MLRKLDVWSLVHVTTLSGIQIQGVFLNLSCYEPVYAFLTSEESRLALVCLRYQLSIIKTRSSSQIEMAEALNSRSPSRMTHPELGYCQQVLTPVIRTDETSQPRKNQRAPLAHHPHPCQHPRLALVSGTALVILVVSSR